MAEDRIQHELNNLATRLSLQHLQPATASPYRPLLPGRSPLLRIKKSQSPSPPLRFDGVLLTASSVKARGGRGHHKMMSLSPYLESVKKKKRKQQEVGGSPQNTFTYILAQLSTAATTVAPAMDRNDSCERQTASRSVAAAMSTARRKRRGALKCALIDISRRKQKRLSTPTRVAVIRQRDADDVVVDHTTDSSRHSSSARMRAHPFTGPRVAELSDDSSDSDCGFEISHTSSQTTIELGDELEEIKEVRGIGESHENPVFNQTKTRDSFGSVDTGDSSDTAIVLVADDCKCKCRFQTADERLFSMAELLREKDDEIAQLQCELLEKEALQTATGGSVVDRRLSLGARSTDSFLDALEADGDNITPLPSTPSSSMPLASSSALSEMDVELLEANKRRLEALQLELRLTYSKMTKAQNDLTRICEALGDSSQVTSRIRAVVAQIGKHKGSVSSLEHSLLSPQLVPAREPLPLSTAATHSQSLNDMAFEPLVVSLPIHIDEDSEMSPTVFPEMATTPTPPTSARASSPAVLHHLAKGSRTPVNLSPPPPSGSSLSLKSPKGARSSFPTVPTLLSSPSLTEESPEEYTVPPLVMSPPISPRKGVALDTDAKSPSFGHGTHRKSHSLVNLSFFGDPQMHSIDELKERDALESTSPPVADTGDASDDYPAHDKADVGFGAKSPRKKKESASPCSSPPPLKTARRSPPRALSLRSLSSIDDSKMVKLQLEVMRLEREKEKWESKGAEMERVEQRCANLNQLLSKMMEEKLKLRLRIEDLEAKLRQSGILE